MRRDARTDSPKVEKHRPGIGSEAEKTDAWRSLMAPESRVQLKEIAGAFE